MAERIKAIETRYKGYRFRSRLEARWAVFFDALGIRYEYEPQGFEISSAWGSDEDNQTWKYLPDFRLTDLQTWVEVKGSLSDLPEDYFDMIAWAIDWGGQLPDVGDSLGTTRGLLWLGGLPPDFTSGCPAHVILQHSKGGFLSDCYFDPDIGLFTTGAGEIYFDATWPAGGTLRRAFEEQVYAPGGWWFDNAGDTHRLREAYAAARSARFEHGEVLR